MAIEGIDVPVEKATVKQAEIAPFKVAIVVPAVNFEVARNS